MAWQMTFCVKSWERHEGRLVVAGLREFTSATEAEDQYVRWLKRSAGVVVLALKGDPEAGVWDEPEIFAAHGEVPDA